MSNWGGYAANQGAFYLNEDAYRPRAIHAIYTPQLPPCAWGAIGGHFMTGIINLPKSECGVV